jgi:predicted Zn-dependent protease
MKTFSFSALAFLFFAAACSTVPVTGRKALILVPDAQVSALSADSYRQLIGQSKLSSDAQASAMVRRVGQRIAAVSDRKDFRWEYNLIDDPKTVNAFCMPGGKVAFYTGILPIARDETGVAVVMGHEVAHAIALHGAERLSQQLMLNMGGSALDAALAQKPEKTRALAMAAFGMGANVGYILPFGRSQESEADRIGLIYMARAGYDPREAVHFWERMEAGSKGGSAPPEFLSTHPSHSRRIADLRQWMPEAVAEYEKASASGRR